MKTIFTFFLAFLFCHLISAQLIDQDNTRLARDQVIPDDLIVQGSECVGFDCVNNEDFGFNTIILKENNLRIKFFDTSVGAFPSSDWILEANETNSGGANQFAIRDETAGTTPFKVRGSAPTNSIFVDASGKVGLRTGTPVLDLHIATSNTPAMRLEQTNAGGFTAQTWDVAGNEANFFVRDVTGGSKLSFRIRPGAPSSSIDIASNGNVGIGTGSPNHKLHVENSSNATSQAIFARQPSTATAFSSTFAAAYLANSDQTNNNFARLNFGDGDDAATAAIASQIQDHANNGGDLSFHTRAATGGAITQRMTIQANGNVIIGSGTADALLSVNGTASKVGGGTWAVFSDKRMKKDVTEFQDGLAQILKITPKKFKYNGVGGVTDVDAEYVGIIAQEMQEIAPYTISSVEVPRSEVVTERSSHDISVTSSVDFGKSDNFLRFDPNALTYMLINAVKEQNNIIETQKVELEEQSKRIDNLESDIAQLKSLIMNQNGTSLELIGKPGFLGQNSPNPYSNETEIPYSISSGAKEARIIFYDINGKTVDNKVLENNTNGILKLRTKNLLSGIYTYQLVVDGQIVDQKKMVLN